MSRPGRKLSPEEADLWARVAKTVSPIGESGRTVPVPETGRQAVSAIPVARRLPPSSTPSLGDASRARPHHPLPDGKGLDASWDRKLSRGAVSPDFTLDLHGASLDAAHGRLMHGLAQARAMGARVVLLVTGRARPVDAADRGHRRGAIRAKVMDWLAHSEHAPDIAAVRNAHPRHGGQGALYVVLRRRRA